MSLGWRFRTGSRTCNIPHEERDKQQSADAVVTLGAAFLRMRKGRVWAIYFVIPSTFTVTVSMRVPRPLHTCMCDPNALF